MTAAETEPPFRLALTRALPTAPAVIGIGTTVCSAAKATKAGTEATLASSLTIDSAPAAAGAGESVALITPEWPVMSLRGSGVTAAGSAGLRCPEMLTLRRVPARPRTRTTSSFEACSGTVRSSPVTCG